MLQRICRKRLATLLGRKTIEALEAVTWSLLNENGENIPIQIVLMNTRAD